MPVTRSSNKRLKVIASSSDEPGGSGSGRPISSPPQSYAQQAQQVSDVFDLFKPNRWLTATEHVAAVQTRYFNVLKSFCFELIAKDAVIFDNFKDMTESWDRSLVALLNAFQEASEDLIKYQNVEINGQECAEALRETIGKIRSHRQNSPDEAEIHQRNPHLATEIILFITEEILERAMPYMRDKALYNLLIASYADQQRTPDLYVDLLNLPSHIPPRHAIRIRRVIDKQRRLDNGWINAHVLDLLQSKVGEPQDKSYGDEEEEESSSGEEDSEEEESEESEDDSDVE